MQLAFLPMSVQTIADEPTPSAAGDDQVDMPERPGKSRRREIVEWVVVVGGALLVALLVRSLLFTTFWIPTGSMDPTLVGRDGRHDRVVVNRLSYHLHDVHRGDIVVFHRPPGVSATTADGRPIKELIKRVVGLPGETVTLRDGAVLVDGRPLTEGYLPPATATDPLCGREPPYVVPEGKVLVMGDNRGDSEDGRCFGPIAKSTIVGRAFVRIWPLGEWTWL